VKEYAVSVIVLVHNNEDVLLPLCKSISRNTKYSVKLIYVDNASEDGSVDFLRRYYSDKHETGYILEVDRNLGVSKGWNEGIKFLRNQRSPQDFIVIMNSDLEVGENWLIPMLEVFEKYPDAGMVDNILKCSRMRSFIQSDGPKLSDPFHYEMSHHPGFRPNTSVIPVQWGTLACAMFNGKVFDEIGLFDENFFIYSSDFDFQLRLKQAGYNIYHTPHSHCFHRAFHTCTQVKRKNEKIARFMGEDGNYFNQKWSAKSMMDFKKNLASSPKRFLQELYGETNYEVSIRPF